LARWRVYTFKAPNQLMQQVDSYAAAKGMTRGEVIRRALDFYLQRHRLIVTRRLIIYP